MPPAQFDDLLKLSQTYRTPLALDESVTGLAQLVDCHRRGWRGIFVVKGAIAGNPLAVLDFCQRHRLDVVFSSVFETAVGRWGVMAMAAALADSGQSRLDQSGLDQSGLDQSRLGQSRLDRAGPGSRALGFGVQHWLRPDGLDSHPNHQAHDQAHDQANNPTSNSHPQQAEEALWQQLWNG